MPGNRDGQYRVQVLDRACGILTALAGSHECLGPSEIGQKLNMSKSTAHRLLVVMERHRMVERDLESGKFRLGLKLVELAGIALSRFDLHRLARPFVQRLAEETGETAHLGILRQSEVISLVNAEGKHNLRSPSTVGRRSPVHCTSQGKVLLACQPPEIIEQFLRRHKFMGFTKYTIRSASRFRAELEAVCRQGYALDNEEFEDGLRCIGAPVRDHNGKVIAAISIAGPAFRITQDRQPKLIRSVVAVADALSAALGSVQTKNGPGENGIAVAGRNGARQA
jgi:DNA-binding IclR family transcriptional regulator